jgi:hypothetical protein
MRAGKKKAPRNWEGGAEDYKKESVAGDSKTTLPKN